MIQRIQSLFWLISIILIAIFVFTSGSTIDFILYVYLLAGAACIFNLLAIFLFSHRRRQLIFSYFAMLAILGLLALKLWGNSSAPPIEISVPILILIGSIIFNILASYFTRKDIKLVEESSRLR
ncbi:MAG: DUF4293 family protein [Chitinophagales bacterium]|jgi:D-alanyl-lipoteichoic acid acyltransferase DltB (MBOAT superfamily)|nr:DUF4293 domain-containing protein [Sphingobacteriales bacterium]